jgi:hypothetical protein
MAKTKDEIVLEMQEQVKKLKSEIRKAEKPTWTTSCSFRETPSSSAINIHVVNDIKVLVGMVAFLNNMVQRMAEAAEELGVTYKHTHDGYSVDDWKSDIKLRLDKINIAVKKTQLEQIEARLAKLESPELKEKRELEELQNLLNDFK